MPDRPAGQSSLDDFPVHTPNALGPTPPEQPARKLPSEPGKPAKPPPDPPKPPPPPDLIDFRPVKNRLTKIYPRNHPVRLAVCAEPDWLPRPAFQAKAEAFLRLAAALR